MKPIQHATNNDVLGAPPGMTVDQCRALPITRVAYEGGGEGVWSYWAPTDEERAAIAAGAPVRVAVMGRTHAPLAIGVDGMQ